MEKEIKLSEFKEIEGYNGKYIISREGIVINTKTNKIVEYKSGRKGVKDSKKTIINLSLGRKTNIVSIESLIFKTFGIDITTDIEPIDGEIWKDVIGYEGLYQVSNMGRVKSLPRIIKQNGNDRVIYGNLMSETRDNGSGYINMYLCNGENGCEVVYAHILVAKHFIHNEFNKETVNHKDGNKKNNKVSNLEWATQKEQSEHVIKNKLRRKNKNSFTDDEIQDIYTELVYNNKTYKYICEKYDISNSYLYQLKNKKNRKSVTDEVDSIYQKINRGVI